MDFILIIERLVSLTKKEINSGDYPSNLSEIASIIRNVFLLSAQLDRISLTSSLLIDIA